MAGVVATSVVVVLVARRKNTPSENTVEISPTSNPITLAPTLSPVEATFSSTQEPKIFFREVPCVPFVSVAENCMLSEGYLTATSQSACLRCLAEAHLDASKQSCAEYIDDFCSAVPTCMGVCPEPCMPYLEDWYSCRSETCNINCLGDGTRSDLVVLSNTFACPTEAVIACEQQVIVDTFVFKSFLNVLIKSKQPAEQSSVSAFWTAEISVTAVYIFSWTTFLVSWAMSALRHVISRRNHIYQIQTFSPAVSKLLLSTHAPKTSLLSMCALSAFLRLSIFTLFRIPVMSTNRHFVPYS